ncbi:regulatory LuxR family protein [Asanoa ferruginea]|uniref:Regulatory LuxR family protein n=1 Tax=Asanoa ferruginea TaxID=53367 RepID=A0A3D9ZJ67_9ACTN|nr:regulatory LuxR family protein [Asanoa ferruginea]GIF48288.1 LuxR family transcriptional regulator [Asanoa ferruginea]
MLLQRDAELASLGRQVATVRAGIGRMIIVDGPAGIGKSSLLSATAETAAAAGIRTLRASGSPLEQDAGWGVARQLFATLRAAEFPVGAAALARRALDADEAEPVRGGDAMHAALHGLTWLAAGVAERGPTLMVVDDVHWADPPSLRWLAGLGRQLGELPLAILCAVRSGEPPTSVDLLDELLALAPEPPVRPGPLGPAAVGAVVAHRLPHAGATFAPACHAATAGNPFLLGALLNHLIAERVEPTDEFAATLSAFGPEQVARSVGRQLGRLPAGSASLARAFAVLGRGAPLRHARELAGLAPDDALRVADRLRAAGLLDRADDSWFLVHPLVAGALYGELGGGSRSLWHARAARLLALERADPEAIALHLLHTEPARDETTVATLRAAASRAGLRGAPQSAAVFLRRALVEPPPDRAVEADLRNELGLALAAHVQPEAPALLAEAVDLAATPEQRARIALSGARALGLSGHFVEAGRLCRSGLDRSDGIAADVRAQLEAELVGNIWLDTSTVDEARGWLRPAPLSTEPAWQVVAALAALFDGAPATSTLVLVKPAIHSGRLDEAGSILATVAKFVLIDSGELDDARAYCTALIEAARPRGWLIALAHGSFLRALALTRAGQISDAVADARFAYEFKLVNSPLPALLWSVFTLVEALTQHDELAEADRVLRSVGDPPPGSLATVHLLETRARLRLAQHQPAQAHADLVAAADHWRRFGAVHPGLACWRVDDAEALVALGDRAEARRLAEEHLDLAARVDLPGPRGAGLRALARTSGRKAVDLLEEAVAVLADSPERLEYARALVDLGAALRRGNHREAAREPLRLALTVADGGGMRLLARRARQELSAAGARPRRAAVTGVDALTSAELRVASLAAEGHSNPEIAQRLFVTRRTVETHLTHVYAKLGVTTRTDLAASLR